MNGQTNILSRGPLLGLILVALLIGVPSESAAQNVVGVSAILNSTSASEIDTYSATEIDYQTSLYYGAYVEGYLYQNGALIAAGSASDPSNAYGYMSKPLQVSSQYQLESDHYLVAAYVYAYSGGTTYWYNPDYYLISNGGSSYPSTGNFAPGGGPVYYSTQYLYLGSTGVQMSSSAPTISSISPSAATVGTSGTITVYGSNLVDIFTQAASVSATSSGISLSIKSATASQVVLNYSIATNASVGNQNLTLSTRFGTSNAVALHIGDPTPTVTGISPGTWNAGATTTITITGKGFGTNPSLSVTGPGVSGSSITGAGDTQIVANVTVAANSQGGSAAVQVQSNGYNGSGFLSTTSGQSSTGSNTAQIQPIPAPVPQIMFNGVNVSGTTQNVLVGQQIALTVGHPPSGLTANSRTWSGVNAGQAIAGWTRGQNPQLPSSNSDSFIFYWLTVGQSGQSAQTLTYSWTLDNGQSNSATVSFNVAGPAGVSVNTTPATLNGTNVNILNPPTSASQTAPLIGLASLNQPGIKFVASANSLPSNGTYTWVQLINSDQQWIISGVGSSLLASSFSGPAKLDKSYPYGDPYGTSPIGTVTTTTATHDTAQDSPYSLLPPTWGELKRSFSATMYLMWDPALPAGCKPDYTCTSLPVPLGTVTWQWNGDAIDTARSQVIQTANGLLTFPQWVLNCGSAISGSFVSSGTYPTWQTVENEN